MSQRVSDSFRLGHLVSKYVRRESVEPSRVSVEVSRVLVVVSRESVEAS